MFRKLHDHGQAPLKVYIDGVGVPAEVGESLAAVLLRQEACWVRLTPVNGSKRAPYCLMGVCFDCLAEVDGVGSVQTCLTTVQDGMRITRQRGKRRLGA